MRFGVATFFAVAATLGMAQAASAADMPAKAPIVTTPVATASWTGLYVNGGIGYGLWAADTTTVSPVTGVCVLCVNQEQGGKGWLGVVGVGYDYQFSPKFVVGVFGDFTLSRLKGTIQDQNPFFAGEIKQTSAWAAGARLGYLITPQTLGYVNGGYTNAHFSSAAMVSTSSGAPTGFSTPAFDTGGWFVGLGLETAAPSLLGISLGPNWYLRSEYRYANYQNKTLADTDGAGAANNSITFKPVVQTVTTQLVYKLNTGGPRYPATPAFAPASWTGIYVNGGVGYGLWAADTTTVSPVTGACALCVNQEQGGKGWLGKVGAGFDWQFMPSFAAGVFGDFDWSSIKGTIQDQGPFFAGEIKQSSAWAVGGRIGWIAPAAVFSYVTGGYTNARFSSAAMVTTFPGAPTNFSTPAFNVDGWFLGGGADVAVAPGWFWRTEYRYARYRNTTLPDTNGAGAANNSITFKPEVQTFTTGIAYKFGWLR